MSPSCSLAIRPWKEDSEFHAETQGARTWKEDSEFHAETQRADAKGAERNGKGEESDSNDPTVRTRDGGGSRGHLRSASSAVPPLRLCVKRIIMESDAPSFVPRGR